MINPRLQLSLLLLAASLSACSLNRAKRDSDKPIEVEAAKPTASVNDATVTSTPAPGSAAAAPTEPTVTLLPAEKAKEDASAQDLSKVTVSSSDSANAKEIPAAKAETPAEAAAAGAANGGMDAPAAKAAKADNSPGGATLTMVPAAKKGKNVPDLKHVKGKGIDGKTALTWLQHGNTRFVKGHFRKDGESKKDIARLTGSQRPHAIVLSCSDSRVPPELVFDQRLGEIFVIRTLGEALDDNAVASIEYGLEQLGIKLIVVLGHNSCGAINAAIEIPEGGNAGSAAMNHLVSDIRPRIKETMASAAPEADGAKESFANAKGIAEDLKKRSAIIREATESGDVMISPALYHLDSGKVTF